MGPPTATAAHALCETIRRASNLRDVTCEQAAGLAPSKLPDLEEEYGVTIGPEARDFFTGVNGLRLEWRYETEQLAAANGYVEGRARLLEFHRTMMGFDGRFWRDELWTEHMPAAELAFAKRLRVVDYVGTDNPRCVCLEVVDDVVTSRLWLSQLHGRQPVVRLDLDLDGYVHALRETKAIWGWQYLYADLDLSRPEWEQARAECRELVSWYPQIFDDGFETQLRERLVRRLR